MNNPNDETDKICNLRKAERESNNQSIIGDYNISLNKDLDYVNYLQDPHQALKEFFHSLQEDSVFIDVFRLLYPYDLHMERSQLPEKFVKWLGININWIMHYRHFELYGTC